MDPWSLTADALREPWRLWTGHLAHYDWEHAAANAVALLVPLVLLPPTERRRAALALLLAAPLLSLVLLPGLGGGEYRGASGLACALWTLAGLHLACRRESATVGLLLLGGLGLKLAAEVALGSGFLVRTEGWQSLPAAHLWGAILGLAWALPGALRRQPT
ncbi:MAG TPA: rhomboid family intramembrane serine protease [Holophagaceae bacterium]